MRGLLTGPGVRQVRSALLVVLVGVVGAYVALALAGAADRQVGPFDARLQLHPAWHGSSVLSVPPLGDLRFATHSGPVVLEVRLTAVRPEDLQRLASAPPDLQAIGEQVRGDLGGALRALLLRDLAVALLGATLAGLVVLRAPRRALAAAGCVLGLLVATGTVAATTFRPRALTEPTFSGVLAYAPAVIGDARTVAQRLDDYSQQLGRLVTNVSTLYATASTLPSYSPSPDTIRLLHISDLHLSPSAYPLVKAVATQFDVDLVLDTGDVTDHGSSVEDGYVDAIGGLGVPYVYVRGNHDSVGTEAAVRRQPGAVVLGLGPPVSVAGLTIMGEADPRFTPDKTTVDDDAPDQLMLSVGRRLRDVAKVQALPPDVVAVHDPISAEPLVGSVPLVLAGHTHARKVTVADGTRVMVEGSTGGAGLRALEGDSPTPVEMTVLYLDRADGTLRAYDEITLGGLGLSDARIRREVVPADQQGAPLPARLPTGPPTLLPSPPSAAR